MIRTGHWFIAAVWAVGLLTGIASARDPNWIPLPTPTLMAPLIAAFVIDLALRPLIAFGRVVPLSMQDRSVAVFGAALVGLVVAALLGP